MSNTKTKPCLFCEKPLTDAVGNDWKTNQPWDGGEVVFKFAFGSGKFDECPGTTRYSALICDDCAAKYVKRMTKDTHVPYVGRERR